jgi:hypothetical protein
MKKILSHLTLLLFSLNFSQAQELPEVIPPSPTVANLMQFEEVPISQYTGVPDISIPIFTKNLSQNLDLNVSLRYSPSGIRIDERSGWTGTGWNLDAGGVISRTVIGIPDEKNVPYQGKGVLHNDYFNFPFTNDPNNYIDEFLWKSARGIENYDTQLDLYQFNFFGKSGRFVVVKDGSENLEARILAFDQKLKIKLFYDLSTFVIDKFEITDEYGIIYTFGEEAKEQTQASPLSSNLSFSGSPYVEVYYSAWKLKKVTTSNSKPLCEFEYISIQENFSTPKNYTYKTVLGNPNVYDSYFGGYNLSLLEGNSYSARAMEISSQKLDRIILSRDSTKIEFDKIIGHPEYSSSIIPPLSSTGCKLNQITVKDNTNTAVETYSFTYSENTTGNRLFLDQIDRTSGNTALPYKLYYDNKDALPGFEDPQKDVWGYFTGGTVTTGVLNKIEYPTGGFKEFGFESNTFSYFGNTPVDVRNIPENQTTLTANWNFTHQLIPDPGFTPDIEFVYVDGYSSNTSLVISNITTAPNSPVGDELNNYFVKITPVTVKPSVGFDPDCNTICPIPTQVSDFETPDYSLSSNFTITTSNHSPVLTQGWYFVETGAIDYISSAINEVNFDLSLTYPNFILNQEYMIGGGLRIKTISFTDLGNVKNKTSYDYREFANSNMSSGSFDGELYSKPYQITRKHTMIYNLNWTPISVSYQVQHINNPVNVQMTKGSYVGYQNVRVFKDNNGETKYTFISPKDEPTFVQPVYPFVPQPDLDYKRGLLMNQQVFDENDRLLKDVSNTYSSYSNPIANSILTSISQFDSCEWDQFFYTYDGYITTTIETDLPINPVTSAPVFPPPITYNCGATSNYIESYSYSYYAGVSQLSSTTTKEYFYEGVNQTVKESRQTFQYNSENFQISQQDSYYDKAGAEEHLQTISYYPVGGDLGSNTATIKNKLIALNKINEVLETQTFRNTIKTTETHTIYDEFLTDVVLPKEVKVAKGTNTPKKRIEFYKYDDYSNLLEVGQTDGTHISYIWGYDKTLPIAKVENATYSSIEALTEFGANFTIADGLNASQETALRNLTNVLVSTFTYNPIIGVISITDAKGYTTNFEYDAFNRLEYIKDSNENIISKNNYHYKNQY